MKLKDALEILNRNDISFVLIGGVALNVHGSIRVTFDSDVAIKTIEADRAIEALLAGGFQMVVGVDADQYPELTRDSAVAQQFIETSKWGFLKFIADTLELDVIYDIPLPFMRLYGESKIVTISGIEVRVASLDHIKIMKEKALEYRDDEKRDNDVADLRFIEKKLKEI